MPTYMAINQYGQTEHGLKHPRKELMERCGVKSASKMYVDSADGKPYHVGYVVAGNWYTLFEVEPYRKPAWGRFPAAEKERTCKN